MTRTRATQTDPPTTAAEPQAAFGNILCAVDGTRSGFTAVRQAAVLAGASGRLTLLSVTAVTGSGAYKHAAINPARAERIVAHAAGLAREAGVSSTQVVDPGKPVTNVIIERAREFDLLAIGAPVSSWLGGMLVGGVAATALGSFTTPLLAARAMPGRSRFADRLLVASDCLEDSDRVVELALRIARSRDSSSVTLLHAVGVESRSRPQKIRQQAQSLELALDGAVETQIEAASAQEVIIRQAQSTRASLVIMGSRRLGGLKAIGSVSRRVVHAARCSVLLVPPEDGRG